MRIPMSRASNRVWLTPSPHSGLCCRHVTFVMCLRHVASLSLSPCGFPPYHFSPSGGSNAYFSTLCIVSVSP